MRIEIPFRDEIKVIETNLPPERVTVAQALNPPGRTWPDVVADALKNPVDAPSIRSQDLSGKRVVMIVDDWGRPTPVSQVVHLFLSELQATGVERDKITFVTAGGMHDPMSPEDLARKLGPDTVER